jgi:hypothetical protein
MDRKEYTTEKDLFNDFCLWEYRPPAHFENKFRSVNLLYNSFDHMGMDERYYDLVNAVRKCMGEFQTVWGVKRTGHDIRWELYFYDYRRRDRERSVSRLLDIIRPFIRCGIDVNEDLHYFMFSMDIHDGLISGPGELDEIHMYIGNPGSSVSSGICYSMKKEETRLENFYFFFDARKDMKDIIAKTVCSGYVDFTQIGIDQIILPELKRCRVIVVANKQFNDSIYFSGIDIDQLIFFMKKMGYPGGLVSFAVENRDRLDHMRYDVGFDYRMEGQELLILKSGYYGFF